MSDQELCHTDGMSTEVSDDTRTGCFGRVPDALGAPLTPIELAGLPDGAEVVIIWSGGNGPHRARVHTNGTYSVPLQEAMNGPFRYYNPITFVGSERFHTRVWTTEKGES